MDNVESSEIAISVKLNSKDLLKFKYARYYSSLKFKLVILWVILFNVVFFIASTLVKGNVPFYLEHLPKYILLSIIVILAPFLLIIVDSIMYMERDRFVNKEHSYKFSDSGFNVSTDCSNLNVKWDELYKIVFSKYEIGFWCKK